MRVGRAAIDEDAIRLLEEYNPDVRFDWTHILKPTPQPAPTEAARERAFEPAQGRAQRRKERRAFPRDAESSTLIAPPGPVREQPPVPEANPAQFAGESASTALQRLDEPRAIDDVFGGAEEEPVGELGPEDRTSAAYQRLGSEGLARLRARYAEVMARIAERPMEDAAREELKLRAERLNPDGWVTADEVQRALEQYESEFEGLRALVGTRRRRRRRRGQGGKRKAEEGSRKAEEGSRKAEEGTSKAEA